MRVEWTVLAVGLALAGCAPQVVYVPQSETMSAKDRNMECMIATRLGLKMAQETLAAVKRCEKDPRSASAGCQEMFRLHLLDKQRGIMDKSNACFRDFNSGGLGVDEVQRFADISGEISRRAKALTYKIR